MLQSSAKESALETARSEKAERTYSFLCLGAIIFGLDGIGGVSIYYDVWRVAQTAGRSWLLDGTYVATGGSAAKAGVMARLSAFASASIASGSSALYYSGHGQEHTGNWCMSYSHSGSFEIISLPEILQVVGLSGNRGLILICDCCHAGAWARQLVDLGSFPEPPCAKTGLAVVFACTAEEKPIQGEFLGSLLGTQGAMSSKLGGGVALRWSGEGALLEFQKHPGVLALTRKWLQDPQTWPLPRSREDLNSQLTTLHKDASMCPDCVVSLVPVTKQSRGCLGVVVPSFCNLCRIWLKGDSMYCCNCGFAVCRTCLQAMGGDLDRSPLLDEDHASSGAFT
eukprot:gnl/MRDRNA2_/MRDRNA2_135785_c0_seq1.p1 gnl/MRDRNA2_/MRDRNA2_135785_c0~~gnl/MRDRNA2_/MRDRNA2_135785_c0_seq1.p1  ORF type:complete len:339 (-),score=49.56 gnl/MRDRNA2_/MRDRNA2_135785_c0_seq1:10-1026(-)